MEICLTSGSSRSCMREVEMCLQADIQAVWATLPWKTEKGRQMKHLTFGLLLPVGQRVSLKSCGKVSLLEGPL